MPNKLNELQELLKHTLSGIRQISTMHLLSEMQALKNIKYTPTAFNPSSTDNYEVYLCSLMLKYLINKQFDRNDLEYLAFTSYLLNSVLAVDTNQTYDINAERLLGIPRTNSIEALQNYILGRCTERLEDDMLVMRKIVDPDLHKIPNVIKALYLIQYSNLVVLPHILKRLSPSDELSFKQQHATTITYYNHLADHFIPLVFQILSREKMFGNLRILAQLNKLLINFPITLFPSIKEFIKNINRFTLNNLKALTLYEIMSTAKLNEYTEVCHNETFLDQSSKTKLVKRIVKKSQELDYSFADMLMSMRYTIFSQQRDLFQPLALDFLNCWYNKTINFMLNQQLHHSEELVFTAISKYVPQKCLKNFHRNYICDLTAKEIDLVYIDVENHIRLAINIDGKDHHYYPGKEHANRKTQVRNKALSNAGWVVICQDIPRMEEGFVEKIKGGLKNEIIALLIKLSPFLKVNIMQAIFNEGSRKPLRFYIPKAYDISAPKSVKPHLQF